MLSFDRKHHIKPILVLFDSCWDPFPKLGVQREPTPGVNNSGWVQSPGAKALADPSQYPRLKEYVQGVVGAFAKDDRILGWEVKSSGDVLRGAVAKILDAAPEPQSLARLIEPKCRRKYDAYLTDEILVTSLAAEAVDVPGAIQVARNTT